MKGGGEADLWKVVELRKFRQFSNENSSSAVERQINRRSQPFPTVFHRIIAAVIWRLLTD
jgi:hypothetical protein